MNILFIVLDEVYSFFFFSLNISIPVLNTIENEQIKQITLWKYCDIFLANKPSNEANGMPRFIQ